MQTYLITYEKELITRGFKWVKASEEGHDLFGKFGWQDQILGDYFDYESDQIHRFVCFIVYPTVQWSKKDISGERRIRKSLELQI